MCKNLQTHCTAFQSVEIRRWNNVGETAKSQQAISPRQGASSRRTTFAIRRIGRTGSNAAIHRGSRCWVTKLTRYKSRTNGKDARAAGVSRQRNSCTLIRQAAKLGRHQKRMRNPASIVRPGCGARSLTMDVCNRCSSSVRFRPARNRSTVLS